ncbi:copper resistance CopC/CopD family protein [Streptomyces chartreusis]|uniref:copper resistance CopC/CopD family protein n=1 Tax=Streptomyces chartreusis TaxID=1969 RepID=UPI002E17D25F|nr:copper resistance protein CopC [Streptomyces chartreusis]
MARQRTKQGRQVGRSLLVVAAVLAGVLLGGAAPASAHAVLTDSDPREGAVLQMAPQQITVSFNESVVLAEDSVRVLDPDSRPVTAGDPEHADGKADTARVPLTGGLKEGTYSVSWRVLSKDSHAVSGAFTFSIGAPSQFGAGPAVEPAVDPAVDLLYGVGRYLAYAGLALLIGLAVFALVCWPGSTRLLSGAFRAGWWALALSTVVLLIVRGPYASGEGLAGVFDSALLFGTMDSRPGIALLVRLALLLLLALLLRCASFEWGADRRTAAAGVLLALSLVGTWTAAEHAAAGIQVPVALVSSALHLLAMAVWLGGLTALLIGLHRAPVGDRIPAAAVARFSRLALASVTVLAATGVYQSWRGLGSWEAFTTSYGRTLALKAGAVVLMLMAASYSRHWTQQLQGVPRQEPELVTVGGGDQSPPPGPADRSVCGPVNQTGTGPDPQEPGSEECRSRLRRSVLAEVVIGVVVLVVTTVLTGSQPGRAAAVSAAALGRPSLTLTVIPFDTGAPGGSGKVQITLEPGRVGRNVVEATTYGPDGSLIAVPELRLTLTQSERNVGPLDAELADQRGYWGSDTLNLPFAGIWTMRATVRVSDIDQVTVEKSVKITS